MTILSLEDAQHDEDGFLVVSAKPGDVVALPHGQFGQFGVVITQRGLDCDCGKGVLCPYNPQTIINSRRPL